MQVILLPILLPSFLFPLIIWFASYILLLSLVVSWVSTCGLACGWARGPCPEPPERATALQLEAVAYAAFSFQFAGQDTEGLPVLYIECS